MIAYITKKINILFYEFFIKTLFIVENVECSCGCKGCCIKYGTYKRKVEHKGKLITLNIQRVFCSNCHHTHSIFPCDLIPYQRLSMDDTIEIIEIYENNPKDIIDDEAKSVIEHYKIWKEKTIKLNAKIRDDILKIISFCAYKFSQCFMQGKRKKYYNQGKLFEVEYKAAYPPT